MTHPPGRTPPGPGARAGLVTGVAVAAVAVVAAAALAGLGVWGAGRLDSRTTQGTPVLTVTQAPVPPRSPAPDRPTHHPARPAASARPAHLLPARHDATPGCAGCSTVFSVRLPHDAHLDGVEFDTTPRTGWLDYYSGGWLVARSGLSEAQEQPGDWDVPVAGTCQLLARVQRCAVAYDTGAHHSGVVLLTVGPRSGITITDRVVGASAGSWLTDLNGDGLPDATVLDIRPTNSAANSGTVWHTYLQRAGKLVSTGCSAPSATVAPVPRHVETGPC